MSAQHALGQEHFLLAPCSGNIEALAARQIQLFRNRGRRIPGTVCRVELAPIAFQRDAALRPRPFQAVSYVYETSGLHEALDAHAWLH